MDNTDGTLWAQMAELSARLHRVRDIIICRAERPLAPILRLLANLLDTTTGRDGEGVRGKATMSKRAVLVTTEYRGVFWGYCSGDLRADTLDLHDMRPCLYWSPDVSGFGGLAEIGPTSGCYIGRQVTGPVQVRKVTSVTICTEAAIEAWLAAPNHDG